jgi:cyclophilin family peptidyl-prolyl cis-trans isomerase
MQARQKGLFKPMSCASFGYAVFGAVVSGMDVVNRIEVVETGQQGSFGDVPLAPIVVESMKLLPLVSDR